MYFFDVVRIEINQAREISACFIVCLIVPTTTIPGVDGGDGDDDK